MSHRWRQSRGKTAYDPWAIEQLDTALRYQTPRLGLWLDTSSQTPAETAEGTGPMKWNLRLAAANRGIWKASELQGASPQRC